MPSFFGNPFAHSGTPGSQAPLFEVRLDNDIIVLRGNENESSSQLLKGSIVLCLRESMKVVDVHMRMTGTLRVGWIDSRMTASGLSNSKIDKTTEIFSHRWAPFVGPTNSGTRSASKTPATTLQAGNHEWPFELVIPGSMAESVEGLRDSFISYRLKATVARGMLAHDLHAYKPVRIVRTLDPAALELAHAMTVENIWPNKIEYSLVIPQKAIMFGTAIEVEMRFTTLLKGLKIGAIRCSLVEISEFTIPGPNGNSALDRYHKDHRDIDHWQFELDEEQHYMDMLDESGQDGFRVKEVMNLPKKLSKCMQDVDVNGIKIRHKVKFNIALHNPDGHVSELRATLPVTIFISPNMPIDESGSLLDQTVNNTQTADISQTAPPLYGEHILDQLYDDIDRSGYMTPGGVSGAATPFYSQSRSGSAENLSSLNGVANTAVPPSALTARLQNLNLSSRNSSFLRRTTGNGSGGNTPLHPQDTHLPGDGHLSNAHSSTTSMHGLGQAPPPRSESGYFDVAARHSPSNPLSRRGSVEDGLSGMNSGFTSGQRSPEHIDFTELTKVPSYTTALKTPLRGMSYSENLPNYETAISRPPSPQAQSEMSYFPPVGGLHPLHGTDGSANRSGGASVVGTPGFELAPGVHTTNETASVHTSSSASTHSRRGPLSHLSFHGHHSTDGETPNRRSIFGRGH